MGSASIEHQLVYSHWNVQSLLLALRCLLTCSKQTPVYTCTQVHLARDAASCPAKGPTFEMF
jgi:hypothetical protein